MVNISHSDRKEWKKCRRKHFFGSKLKLGLEPISEIDNKFLVFGSAIHAGIEAYYNNIKDNSDEYEILILKDEINQSNLDSSTKKELIELGESMLWSYFDYADEYDNFEVIAAEKPFKVPIPVDTYEVQLEKPFGTYKNKYLTFEDSPVFFIGVVDLLVKNHRGHYWIYDHKTTSSLSVSNDFFFSLDEQITSYIWALKQMGYDIKGFVYQELLKAKPTEIKPMKSRNRGRLFSTAKRNRVVKEQYVKILKEYGENLALYKDYLAYLDLNPNPFFQRTEVTRTIREINNFGIRLVQETIDMLAPDNYAYMAPDKFTCKMCSFKDPCIALERGENVDLILTEMYRKKEKIVFFDEIEVIYK